MRVAIIYRPRNAPPADRMPEMFGGLAQWIERYEDKMETLELFVGGGGFGIMDVEDAAELHRMTAEHPFTPFADVEIRPVVEAGTAMRNLQEAFAARAS